MTTLHVQLSEATVAFLTEQARAEGLASASEYLAALAAEAEANRDALEEKLLQGKNSGPVREMTAADWDQLKRRVSDRQAAGRGK
jgi:hypothetical protein